MDQNPYAAPSLEADARVADVGLAENLAWFPVGTRKLWVMSILSLGIYPVFWFERQFRFQKRARLNSTRPVWRAIFSVFFAHELFRSIEFTAAGSNIDRSWQASTMGGLFVASAIANRVLDRVSDKLLTGTAASVIAAISIAMVAGLAYPIAQVQGTVNQILDRTNPGHDKNDRFTAWNWLVIALGALVLALATLGLVMPPDAAEG